MCKIDAVAFGLNWVELAVVAILIVGAITLFCFLVRYVNTTPVKRTGHGYADGYQPLWKSETRTIQPPPKKP